MKKHILIISLLSMSLGLIACDTKKTTVEKQPQPTQTETSNSTSESQVQEIAAVWSKTYKMDVVNSEICTPESEESIAGCTVYDVQSVKTNVDWINKYYENSLRELYAENAFGKKNDFKLEGEQAERKFYEGSIVRFENQQYNLVTFSQFSNSYSGGAHNIYANQYDVFDLKLKKKLSLNDIFTPNAKAKVLALVKEQNQEDLKEYQTDVAALELTDNFYFGPHGLVFVYSPYEIAAFVYGITELTVSYRDLAGLLKAEYLPQLPDYSLSEDFS